MSMQQTLSFPVDVMMRDGNEDKTDFHKSWLCGSLKSVREGLCPTGRGANDIITPNTAAKKVLDASNLPTMNT